MRSCWRRSPDEQFGVRRGDVDDVHDGLLTARSTGLGALRPTGMRHRYTSGQDLARLRPEKLVDPVRTEPLRDHHEQHPAVLVAEHARVAGAVELDPVEHITTLADAKTDTSFVRSDVAAPHGAFGVEADPVARDVGPHAPRS